MSDEIGFVAVLSQDGEQAYPWMSQASERTRQRVDDEVRRIVDDAHDDAIQLLSENRDRLDSLAEALVREETLDQPQAYAAAGLTPPGDGLPAAAEVAPAASSAT
jgi:cell division protease FtsH